MVSSQIRQFLDVNDKKYLLTFLFKIVVIFSLLHITTYQALKAAPLLSTRCQIQDMKNEKSSQQAMGFLKVIQSSKMFPCKLVSSHTFSEIYVTV